MALAAGRHSHSHSHGHSVPSTRQSEALAPRGSERGIVDIHLPAPPRYYSQSSQPHHPSPSLHGLHSHPSHDHHHQQNHYTSTWTARDSDSANANASDRDRMTGMESRPSEQRIAPTTTAATTSTTTAAVDDSSLRPSPPRSSPSLSLPRDKDLLRFAEMGDWPALLQAMQQDASLARRRDQHGMLALHWACTESDVPPAVIMELLQLFPEAVLTRNNAQFLPLHLAVRARACEETLRLLCDARPSSLLEQTPTGRTALQLAVEANLPLVSLALLRSAEAAYADVHNDDGDAEARAMATAKRDIEAQSHWLRESMRFTPHQQPSLQEQEQHEQQQEQDEPMPPYAYAYSRGARTERANSTATVSSVGSYATTYTAPPPSDESRAVPTRFTRSVTGGSNSSNSGYPPQRQTLGGGAGPSSLQAPRSSAAVMRYTDSLMHKTTISIDEEARSETSGAPSTDASYSVTGSSHLGRHPAGPGQGGANSNHHRRGQRPAQASTQSQSQSHAQAHAEAQRMGVPALPSQEGIGAGGDGAHQFHSGVCSVCYKKFSVFRKKYQCKGCWTFLCRKHVAGRIDLPNQTKKRSACAECFVLHAHGVTGIVPAGGGAHRLGNHVEAPSTISFANGRGHGHGHDAHQQASQWQPRGTTIVHNRTDPDEMADAKPDTRASRSSTRRFSSMTAPPPSSTSSARGKASPPRHPTTIAAATNSVAAGNGNGHGRRSASVTMGFFHKQPKPRELDRYGSDTTASLSDGDRNSAEVTALHHRIAALEEQNRALLARLTEQEKQNDESMLLLTQTMTRVAEIEMKLPALRVGATESERDETESSDGNPAAGFDFGYQLAMH